MVLTHLLIGHTRLTHSYLLKQEDQPFCISYNEPFRVKHFLIDCVEYSHVWCQFLQTNDLRYLFQIVPADNASVAQLNAPSDWRPGGHGFNPRRGRQQSFVEIDREIFSTVILSLPLIQEGQLSVSGERMCTILVNRLED